MDGAMQAQDYTKSKWAVGLRLEKGKLQQINEAYEQGKIVRTHVMRPTWHLVSGKDIRWMMKLTGPRMLQAISSWAKSMHVPEDLYERSIGHIEKILQGNSLTRPELTGFLIKEKILKEEHHISYLLSRAEANCIICSGPDKEGKSTFALLDERIPPVKELTTEESLALLAVKYFRSHSPATLNDFTWWSGLSMTEAKKR